MNLRFVVPEFEYSARSLSEFLTLSQSSNGETFQGMGASILTLYPELDGNELKGLSDKETFEYVYKKLGAKYEVIKPEMIEKCGQYQETWDTSERDIEEAFGQIFGVDTEKSFNEMIARINMNPICPRFIEDRSFDVFYLYSDKGAMSVALHEITHFIWFEVWNRVFGDNPELYEQPHLPWIISELAIDAVLTDKRLNGFIANEHVASRPAYPEFYEILTPEGMLIDTIRELYKNNDMEAFMRETLRVCERNKELFDRYFS